MTATPPKAVRKPVTTVHHGVELVDDWDWLKDPENPETIAHLEAENAYTDAVTADQQPLRDAIFHEIKSHTVETDMSVPSRINDWWYFTRTEEGRSEERRVGKESRAGYRTEIREEKAVGEKDT